MNFIFVSWQLLFLTEIVTSKDNCMKAIRSLNRKRKPIQIGDVQKFATCLNRQNDDNCDQRVEKKEQELLEIYQPNNDYSYDYPGQDACLDITQDPTKIANYNKCDDQETDQDCILRLQGMLQKFSDMDQNLLDRDDEDRNEYQNRLRTMVVLTRQKSDFYSNLFERCDKEEKMV